MYSPVSHNIVLKSSEPLTRFKFTIVPFHLLYWYKPYFMQSKVMSKVKPMLEESIKSLYCTSVPSSFKVADFGCSSGPNALQVASDIIDIVDTLSSSFDREPPTFQFFLNDQFRNDFNNIFESLPYFYERLQKEKGERLGSCFVNATPGSFYGRLFPNNSMHFFHSSTSLHWLSQVNFNKLQL